MPPNVLEIYRKLSKLPMGLVLDMRPGFASVRMKPWGTIGSERNATHEVAVGNLVEMCMGMVAEATIPKHLRWIPMGMDIDYLKEFRGEMTASATIDKEKFFTLDKYPGPVAVPVEVRDPTGEVACNAKVRLWISEKPTKH